MSPSILDTSIQVKVLGMHWVLPDGSVPMHPPLIILLPLHGRLVVFPVLGAQGIPEQDGTALVHIEGVLHRAMPAVRQRLRLIPAEQAVVGGEVPLACPPERCQLPDIAGLLADRAGEADDPHAGGEPVLHLPAPVGQAAGKAGQLQADMAAVRKVASGNSDGLILQYL